MAKVAGTRRSAEEDRRHSSGPKGASLIRSAQDWAQQKQNLGADLKDLLLSSERGNGDWRLLPYKGRSALFALFALAAFLGSQAAAAADRRAPFDQEPFTHPQRLVTIEDGRSLNLYCTGHGTPTVVLDSGWGGPTTAWVYVQPKLSRMTRICSYDRAGQGFSDPGPLPRDTNALVTDLHALLHAANIKPPYIFVGHSLAGLDGILFADRYLNELSGIVLVDPAFAHEGRNMESIHGIGTILAKLYPDFSPCKDAARQDRLPTNPAIIDRCLDRDSEFGPALTSTLDRMSLRPSYWTDRLSEMDSYGSIPSRVPGDIDSTELDREARSLRTLPMVVLTAGNDVNVPGSSAQQRKELRALINKGHERLTSLSQNRRRVFVPGSSHYIQFDRPDVVVGVIRDLVNGARKTAASTGK